MMKIKLFTYLMLGIVVSGCSVYSINSEETTKSYYPSKQSISEVSYMNTVEKPHDIIGYVEVKTERNQRISDVIEKMKREAALLGADAITQIETDATGTWKTLPAQNVIGNGFVRAKFKATMVVFK